MNTLVRIQTETSLTLGALQGAPGVENLHQAQSLLMDLWQAFLYRLPGLGVGVVLMALFIVIAGPLSRLLLKPFSTSLLTPLIKSVAQRSISVVIMLLGIYLFLFLSGLTGFAVAVISGTGVVGLILGFAFRDIAENFISSLLLTIQRPFRIGDVVQINDSTGIIQKVTSRATTLVDFDGNHIQIPNATIYKGVIKNLTANPLMRGHFQLGVGYDADIKFAQTRAVEIISGQDGVLNDPEPQVLIDNLGPSTFNLKIYFWVNAEQTSVLKMASLLMRKTVVQFTEAGISMPDDARERVFPKGVTVSGNLERYKAAPEEATPISETPEADMVIEARLSDATNAASLNGKPEQGESGQGPLPYDDVSSEAQEIREQARKARDPESGTNIL